MNAEAARLAPRMFLSHASEDKQRFVLDFAKRLRASGVDIWLDRWEMRPGDSLVRKIFTDGIDQAEFFMVVISQASVDKPWVQEELDAGVVRKINGSCRLIPVVLDAAPVPPALTNLLYVDVERLGIEGAIAEVLRVVFDGSLKPPIGAPPSYMTREIRYLSDPIDDMVAERLLEALRADRMIRSDELRQSLKEAGVEPEQVDESVAALKEKGLISVSYYLGGTYLISRVTPAFWLDAEAKNGVDIDRATALILGRLVSDGYLDPRGVADIHELTARSVIELAEDRGLLTTGRSIGGRIRLATASPTLRRMLRSAL